MGFTTKNAHSWECARAIRGSQEPRCMERLRALHQSSTTLGQRLVVCQFESNALGHAVTVNYPTLLHRSAMTRSANFCHGFKSHQRLALPEVDGRTKICGNSGTGGPTP